MGQVAKNYREGHQNGGQTVSEDRKHLSQYPKGTTGVVITICNFEIKLIIVVSLVECCYYPHGGVKLLCYNHFNYIELYLGHVLLGQELQTQPIRIIQKQSCLIFVVLTNLCVAIFRLLQKLRKVSR